MSKQAAIQRLDELLNKNITWAVKITSPAFSDAILKHNYRGKDQIWIHAGMVPGGNIYDHVVQLAKEKNLSQLDFEIKRKRGNSYDRIPANQLEESKFTVTIMNQANQTAGAGIPIIPSYSGTVPGVGLAALASPELQSQKVGLGMPEFLNLNQRSYDAGRLEIENAELKTKLDAAETKLKEKEKQDEENKKPSAQDRFMNLLEKDGVALKAFDLVEKLTSKLTPGGALAKPEVNDAPQINHPSLPATLQQLENYLLQVNDQLLNQKLLTIAYSIKNFPGFDEEMGELISRHKQVNEPAAPDEKIQEVA